MILARRTLLFAGPAILAMSAMPLLAEGDERIHVVKDPGCPCCNAWIGHLRENGFNVSFEERSVEDLAAYKRERGIPENLSSCTRRPSATTPAKGTFQQRISAG